MLLATGYWLLTTAAAVEIRVLEADTLEIRPISVPGGEATELLVITGSPVRMEVGGDAITAEYIEFDREARLMRIVGPGDVGFEGVTTQGRDYLLDVSSEELSVRDVVIFTEPIDIQGVQATRMPGQIDITAGAFSPCSRCDQEVQDYRFSADRLILYPGDRLVAYGVTVFVRELPSMVLPVMVVPLGPEDRRPRFSVSQGSATTRAEAALDWPYVLGADAFGTLSLRYYADVTPGASRGPTEGLLGGRVDESYLGGGFDGRFYTATGEGEFGVFYTPAFVDPFAPGGRTQDQLELTLGYSTQEALGGTQFEVLIERDDTLSPRILTYTARVGGSLGGPLAPFGVRYVTQGFFDLDPDDAVFTPSYRDPEGPLRTLSRVQVTQDDGVRFSVGPFTLSGLRLDAGAFEDFANPNNLSAQLSPVTLGGRAVVQHGRLLAGHTVELAPVVPFAGASLSGRTTFTGQYYTSQNTGGEFERLVDWNTSLTARQEFGVGSLELALRRNILEGETPFSFDARATPNNRTDLTSTFRFRPAAWFDLQLREVYVFEDARAIDAVGPGPLESRLTLFGNVNWLNVSLEHLYDFAEGDPGVLSGTLDVRTPEGFLELPVDARVRIDGAYDLDVTGDRVTGAPRNASEVGATLELGYLDLVRLDASSGYDWEALPGFDEGFDEDFGALARAAASPDLAPAQAQPQGVPRWRPLELGVSVGTLPAATGALGAEGGLGARVFYQRDLNVGRPEAVGFELAAPLGPVQLAAEQIFDFASRSDDSLFQLTWPGVAQLSGTGFRLLPPTLLGLTPDPRRATTYQLSLLDQTNPNAEVYELTYRTTYGPFSDPVSFEERLGFFNTSFVANIELLHSYLQTPVGPIGFGVDFLGQLLLADDALAVSYLSSSDLTLSVDVLSRVGLQGSLAYGATFDPSSGTFSQRALALNDFGLTVRVLDDLYVSALITDLWDFTGTRADASSPFNLQPILYVTLNRCCWALYGALDTRDGTLSLTVGYPGAGEGFFESAFETPLALPRRRPEGGF
ncbi:hypothetical protein [Truepera radiovictrix]|uniref:LPS-assembly protein LptD n=1 Tax=Truepera radiovictrix (strain DSM 17093 / CIP 108686 / LMG 22925 / RQ-24) TaxID=649638 RepID=D7CR75_TRURR|nr:hypothetical protein [Truepera radiovictrix]ADI15163.1 hypothetical protein Trad_2049 [Truepera radiovictrix DSM 17093]WMT56284.1 hypothetical protein RCV51_09745 [Truepera radiovictrix]